MAINWKKSGVRCFALLLIVVFVIIVIVIKYPIKEDISKKIDANIFYDDRVVGETTIEIDGIIVHKLFSDSQAYSGQFNIKYYDEVCREGVQARIGWEEGKRLSWLRYNYAASRMDVNLNEYIFIDKDMNEIAIGLVDGKIIATSEEIMQEYKQFQTE